MKTAIQRYNARQRKHEAVEQLARQLQPRLQQSLRRCRSAAKQMLQGGSTR